MRLLVVGADRVDAGKTTFTIGLLARTGAVGFKPRAGNDFWFHADDVRHAIGQGRLFGGDARKLVSASTGTLAPEEINPVHRLWQPSPSSGSGLLGKDDREFVVDRVGEEFVVNGTVDLPDLVGSNLPLDDVNVVRSLPELNDVMARLHVPALAEIGRSIRRADRAVVESYGDVARPLRDVEPDAVAVVEPTRARLYDGERYRKACEVATGSPDAGQLEERVETVLELLEPGAAVELSPLGSDERSDPAAVSDAYADAYDELLGLAES